MAQKDSKNGSSSTAQFNQPGGIAIDSKGNIFIADSWNHRIRKIDPSGEVSTFAGNGSGDYQDGTGTNASFYVPADIAIDQTDHLYVADRFNDKIRKITPDGVVTTIANSATFSTPVGIEVDHSGNIYVASDDPGKRISPSGEVTTFTNRIPEGIVVDEQSNIYLSVYENKIYRIDSSEKKLFMPVQALQFKPMMEMEQQNLIDRLTLP